MHHNGKEQLDDTSKKAQERLNRILEQVKARGKVLFTEGMSTAKSIFDEKAKSVRKKAGELSEKSVSEIGDDVTGYIQRNPYKSVGIAVGCGLLLGLLLSSGSDDSE